MEELSLSQLNSGCETRDKISGGSVQENKYSVFPLVALKTNHRHLANANAWKIGSRQGIAVERLNSGTVLLRFRDEFVMFHNVPSCSWRVSPFNRHRDGPLLYNLRKVAQRRAERRTADDSRSETETQSARPLQQELGVILSSTGMRRPQMRPRTVPNQRC